ncbi:MAG: tetrahydrofolate dehydrogenase/cyclohydrolase catalytic domain-containing protein [Dehalococcoidales bacterium]|nr:tetrahydrofolate dehydrogenase/cyclohydrolase catalytic domain-containing protein [Dehalococcoidales bacterium]
MTARIINGIEIANQIREELKAGIIALKSEHNLIPGLVTILVGVDPASQVYVSSKVKACQTMGIYSERYDLPADTGEQELLALIKSLNKNSNIHGILVQVPLPKHINENTVLMAIDPIKDVDGFHPINIGKLMIGEPDYLPCTPYGIQILLIRSHIETEGADVVIIGRSNILGKPMAAILMQKAAGANATVTVCHTKTRDLISHTRRADILIAAAGNKPKFITADMVKEGVVIIDASTHRIGQTSEGKAIICGDVDFDSVKEKAKAITPVPGGVGPMTITMLMSNTIKAAKLINKLV